MLRMKTKRFTRKSLQLDLENIDTNKIRTYNRTSNHTSQVYHIKKTTLEPKIKNSFL